MKRRFFMGLVTQGLAVLTIGILGKDLFAQEEKIRKSKRGSSNYFGYGRPAYGYGYGYPSYGYGYSSYSIDAYGLYGQRGYGYGYPYNYREQIAPIRTRQPKRGRGVSSDGALNIDFEKLTNRKS